MRDMVGQCYIVASLQICPGFEPGKPFSVEFAIIIIVSCVYMCVCETEHSCGD